MSKSLGGQAAAELIKEKKIKQYQRMKMAAIPIHIVNGPYGHRYKAGDDVIINKSGHRQHDQLGKVITVRNYDDNPKITVTFEGGFDTAKFSPEELILT